MAYRRIIPESAPFNAEQRAWLNGFLAGWLGLQDGAALEPAATLTGDVLHVARRLDLGRRREHGRRGLPWHDPALPIDERLKLAEGKPMPRRLMAAMAQLDCGACGYLCRTYSEAIADGAETSPHPLLAGRLRDRRRRSSASSRRSPDRRRAANGWRTERPTLAQRRPNGNGRSEIAAGRARTRSRHGSSESVNLNRPGSEKETRHVEIDLGADGPSYKVGDSLGVYPENCDDARR